MAFTVEETILEARDQHPSFDPQRTPDGVCQRQLNRYLRQLYYRAIERDSNLYSTVEEITLPLADFDAGHALPAFVYYQGGTLNTTGTYRRPEPFNIVPWANRFMPNVHSAGYILEGTLYLCGDAEDWTGATSIDFYYAPELTLPAAMADPVPLADGAKWPCVNHLAWQMARRQGSYEGVKINTAEFAADWKSAEEEWLIEIAQHSRGEATYVRAEW